MLLILFPWIVLHRTLKRIDWLLIDVEGFEYEVLLGAEKTLKKTRI
ncbi:MAG: FkbM family methyltransferase [Thermoplasmata archaeon]